MAHRCERQPGFVNFLTKKDQFGVFYFVMIRILERIGIHPVAKFKRNRSDWDEFFRLLLAILSSLQGYVAHRGIGARCGTAGSGSSLWA